MPNVIGFDYGRRRIGVAVGLLDIATANPLMTVTVPASGIPWDKIDRIMAEWQPRIVIVGCVEHNDQLHDEIHHFCKDLQARYDIPVEKIDESYTSATAYQMLKDMRVRGQRGKIKKTDVDKAAAAIILHAWLSSEPEQRGKLVS